MTLKLFRSICIVLALFLSACASAPSATAVVPPTSAPSATPVPATAAPTVAPTIVPTATRPPATPTAALPEMKSPIPGRYLGVYDPAGKRVLLINADSSDIWAYDTAANVLTRLKDRAAGISLSSAQMDVQSGKVIALQGSQGIFWEYDPAAQTWTALKAVGDAMQGYWYMENFAYDSTSKQAVLVAYGNANKPLTFLYDLSAQTYQMLKTTTTEALTSGIMPMNYDAKADRVLLWKDFPEPAIWSFDANTAEWTIIPSTGGPKELGVLYSSLYISELDRTFFLCNQEFYSYDSNKNQWERAAGEVKAPARTMPAMAYDPGAKKLVVFGGVNPDNSQGPLGDLWTYDPQTGEWVQQKLPK